MKRDVLAKATLHFAKEMELKYAWIERSGKRGSAYANPFSAPHWIDISSMVLDGSRPLELHPLYAA